MRPGRWIAVGIIIAATVCADRFAKAAAHADARFDIVPGVFSFSGEINTGIAWGITVLPAAIFWVITAVLIVCILFTLRAWSNKNYFMAAALLGIDLGAASNLVDRIMYGSVIDYLTIGGFLTFNLADLMVVSGVSMIGVRLIFRRQQ